MKNFSCLIVLTVALEDAVRVWELREVFVLQVAGIFPGERETVFRQFDGGRHDPIEWKLPVFLQGVNHAGDGTGNANRPVTHQAGLFDDVALRVEVHVGGRSRRSLFAVVDEVGGAVGHADKHEPTPAEISCLRVHDGEGEARGDGGVDGVAAGLHYLYAGARGQLVDAGHHGVRRVDGMRRSGQRARRQKRRDQQRPQKLAVNSHRNF